MQAIDRSEYLLTLRVIGIRVVGQCLLADEFEDFGRQWHALGVALALVQIDHNPHERRH